MTDLRWTTERPDKPGWYWFTHEHIRPYVVHVELLSTWGDKPILAVRTYTSMRTLDEFDGQWAGPIEPPKEAAP